MLTTSQKITTTFIISIFIMATLAFFGYRGLTDVGAGYRNSNRLAAIDISISHTLRALNDTVYLSTVFLRIGDSKDMTSALESLDLAQKRLNRGIVFTEVPSLSKEQKRQVESTASAMHEMNTTVLEVARNTGETSTQTEETLEKSHDSTHNLYLPLLQQQNNKVQPQMKLIALLEKSIWW